MLGVENHGFNQVKKNLNTLFEYLVSRMNGSFFFFFEECCLVRKGWEHFCHKLSLTCKMFVMTLSCFVKVCCFTLLCFVVAAAAS